MRQIFESLLTMERRSWSGSWARASSTCAKAQQASIVQAFVHVQVDVQDEVELHDEQVAWVALMGRSPRFCMQNRYQGLKARPIEF